MERIKLNLIPSGVAPIVHLSQYDDGRQFGIDLFEGESVYVLDGTETLTVNSRKPDGHVVTLTVTNTGTSSLDVDTVEQLTAVHGVSYAKLQIVKGTVTIATLPFLIDVSRDPLENGDPSESFIQNLRTQIAEGVAEDVAEQYDSANVIFDTEPTDSHGIGYTVTSEGIKTAIDNAFDYDNTASGSLVHIEDGADNIPVKSLTSEIVAVESGNGQPKSHDNQYTISGWSSANISRSTKNILDLSSISGYGANRYFYRETGLRLVSGQVYTFSLTSACNGIYIRRMSDNTNIASNTNQSSLTFTATDELIYITLWRNDGFTDFTYQLEIGDTATAYEEPNTNIYTFTFGQTVYGGHFDNKGNLVVTHGVYIFTGSEGWTKQQNLAKYYSNNYILRGLAKLPPTNNQSVPIKTAIGDYNLDYANLHSKTYSMCLAADGRVGITEDLHSEEGTLEDVWLYYELETPITLAITSQDIPTLLGENNFFSNCGDIEVTYYTNKANDILDFINSEIGKKNGTNIPIEENSQDSIKDYIDNVSLSGLPDTDISGETSGQILAFDGVNWVNTNQIAVKYEEIDVTLDASGEGTLFDSVKFVVGLKDIPSDSLYVAYVSYINVGRTMVKAFSRSAIAFSSQSNVSSTRKVGVYYLDNIATQ